MDQGTMLTEVHYRGLAETPIPGRTSLCSENLQEFEVPTESGVPLRVYVQRGKGSNSIVTYHDIGTNHTSFLGFFNYPEMRVLLQHFTVYHVCAPGHHETAGPLAAEMPSHWSNPIYIPERGVNRDEQDRLLPARSASTGNIKTAGNSGNNASFTGSQIFTIFGWGGAASSGFRYPNLDELAQMLDSVVEYFQLKHFLAFGMGAGANLLIRYALHAPNRLLGLFLINPNATTASYYQWIKNRWSDLPQLQRGVVTDGILNLLENHWFGTGQAQNSDLIELYEQTFRILNPTNLAGYIEAYLNRTDLGLVRELDVSKRDPAHCVDVETCLVTGDRATDLSRAMADMNGRMDPAKTQFIAVPDCTGMLMEEHPERLAYNFLHFLRNCGLLINMTPEKLREQTVRQQTEAAMLSTNKDTAYILEEKSAC